MSTVVLSLEQREKVRAAYAEHTTDPKYAPLLAEAKDRGYRLAEPWERETLGGEDLYSWRGTVWVKLGEGD